MLLSRTTRLSALTLATVSIALLAGCASQKPHMDSAASTASTSAASNSAAMPAGETTENGVQTIKNPRFFGILSPYRYNIQQGNFVSKEMISQVKEGMTHEQVAFALGTPLLTDMFHADRWDYVFRLQKGNGEITSSHVTVLFKDKLVSKIEGGDLPTEADYLARISGGNKEARNATKDDGIAKDAPLPPSSKPAQ